MKKEREKDHLKQQGSESTLRTSKLDPAMDISSWIRETLACTKIVNIFVMARYMRSYIQHNQLTKKSNPINIEPTREEVQAKPINRPQI